MFSSYRTSNSAEELLTKLHLINVQYAKKAKIKGSKIKETDNQSITFVRYFDQRCLECLLAYLKLYPSVMLQPETVWQLLISLKTANGYTEFHKNLISVLNIIQCRKQIIYAKLVTKPMALAKPSLFVGTAILACLYIRSILART